MFYGDFNWIPKVASPPCKEDCTDGQVLSSFPLPIMSAWVFWFFSCSSFTGWLGLGLPSWIHNPSLAPAQNSLMAMSLRLNTNCINNAHATLKRVSAFAWKIASQGQVSALGAAVQQGSQSFANAVVGVSDVVSASLAASPAWLPLASWLLRFYGRSQADCAPRAPPAKL